MALLAAPRPESAVTTSGVPAEMGSAGPRTPWVRLGVALGAWVIALAFSLRSLIAEFTYQSPVGELLVVPVIAAVLVVVAAARHRHQWPGRLGHGDFVVAGGLLFAAAATVVSGRYDEYNAYWLLRPDLLAAPLVLAGFLVLMLGMRALTVCGFGIAFSLLAWPYPVTLLGSHVLEPLTGATFFAGGHLAELLGAADRVNSGEHVLRIHAAAGDFEVAVASACSGLSSIVGYALTASAALYLIDRRPRAKLTWLTAGLATVWVAAAVRIALIAVGGHTLGAGFALDVLHPSASLVLDAIVFAAAVAVLHRFGLRWKPWSPPVVTSLPLDGCGIPVPSLRSYGTRFAVIVLATTALFSLEMSLAQASLRSDFLGNVPTGPVTEAKLERAGVQAEWEQRFDWSQRYFGATSSWNRYQAISAGPTPSTVWIDSVVVDDPDALRVHGVVSCYNFHGASVLRESAVRLDGMLRGTVVVLRQPDGDVWHSTYWQWPVLQDGRLRHERVVLIAASAPTTKLTTAAPGVDPDPVLTQALIADANRIVHESLRHDGDTSG